MPVKKSHTFLLHLLIMVTATLLVFATVLTTIYFQLLDRVDSAAINEIRLSEINQLLIHASGIAVAATLFFVVLASIIYFRITQPLAQKIKQQAETFHMLVNSAHEGIFLIDIYGIIQFVNPAAETLFGYAEKELMGQNIKQLMPSPHREKHDSYIASYLNTGIKKIIGSGRQLLGQRKDGSQFPMYLSVGEIQLQHTHLFTGLIMDLSTQQKLQRELLAIPAREQRRIGEELHDGIGQQLTGLSMLAQSLLNKATKPEYELAGQIASGLHEALNQVRALSRGLMPVQIYADGFMTAIQSITENIEKQSHIPIKLKVDNVELLLDDVTATHLYRIVQESLNNAVKHAEASQIEVLLNIGQDQGVLEVIDNGIGIPLDLDESPGLGLNIMRHRCGLFDGEITINPGGNCGTRVCCRFPIDHEAGN